MIQHIQPLDDKTFIVERFHEAPQHYLKVGFWFGYRDCIARVTMPLSMTWQITVEQ
ncbi:unnamed protein product [Symbiodinium sp. CCMP2592]|nr:unnamed protein product [Symbiodinium sp. CCMP2592]